jgi:hypothetical protein
MTEQDALDRLIKDAGLPWSKGESHDPLFIGETILSIITEHGYRFRISTRMAYTYMVFAGHILPEIIQRLREIQNSEAVKDLLTYIEGVAAKAIESQP